MEFGYFAMPSHPPESGLKAGHDWDLQTLRWLDELGYTEAWIGEHHTAPWEPHPAPDLLIAQALMQTKRLRIGPGGFLLPYHHPAELANRVAMLDHLVRRAAEFRRRRVGAGQRLGDVPGRRQLRRASRDDARVARHHPAAVERREGLRIRRQVLEGGEAGRDVRLPAARTSIRLQKPHPPIGVAGVSKQSDTLKLAGERGFLPMSLNLNPGYVGEPLGGGGDGRRAHRAHAEPRRLAAGARGVRRRYRRGGVAAVGRTA